LVQIIPMAFVMIAGPQILSAIFLATSENWRRNSAAYIAGAALSITPDRHDRVLRRRWCVQRRGV
jgi:small neutral amino acid transporter SnatA (MarC family)